MTKFKYFVCIMGNIIAEEDSKLAGELENLILSMDSIEQKVPEFGLGNLENYQQIKKELKNLLYKVGRKMQENIDGLCTDRKYINQRKVVE